MSKFSCGANLARLFLVIFNLIFVIVGLALIAVGGLLKGGAKYLDTLGDFVKYVPGLDSMAIGIIVVGCVIFLIGAFGTCGACCSVRWMLVLYAVLVIIITLAEIILVALLFSGKLDKLVKDGFSKLTKKYQKPTDWGDIDDADVISRLIDAVFIELKCCDKGIRTKLSQIPLSCCKGATKEAFEKKDLSKMSCSGSTDSYIDVDCGTALINTIRNNQGWVIGICVGLLVIELLCIVFALWIFHQANTNKVSSF